MGKIHKVYVQDPGLRDILKLIELDSDRAKAIQGHKLRLITSVVYSERLKLRGKRFTEVMKTDGYLPAFQDHLILLNGSGH